MEMTSEQAAIEYFRRQSAKDSLLRFANAIDIPGKPVTDDDEKAIYAPIETSLAAHHVLLLDHLEKVARGEIKHLMVFMPPGAAKSVYTSTVFPTWYMGWRPGARVILSSYGTDLARRHGKKARTIVVDPKYRSIFNTTLSAESGAADDWALTNKSEFMACGLLAGVTGRRADIIIVDDPVAGREEADSETNRKKTRAAYEDDLRTRLLPGGREIIIQTRWHCDDLSGGILPADWRG